MTDQTKWGIDLIQQGNKARSYHRENTDKLRKAQDIWKNTNQLDNITEHMMRKFNSILRGGA